MKQPGMILLELTAFLLSITVSGQHIHSSGYIKATSANINPVNFFSKQTQLNDSLVQSLRMIDFEDQRYRQQMDDVTAKYGRNSKEIDTLFFLMKAADSTNSLHISGMIDKYGWLGPDIIGDNGASTLFGVIQHSDLKTQEKYLPLMQQAVKEGKAKAGRLALLEDRVALKESKKQIYGSQIAWTKTNEYYVAPLEDPDNVDKRRASVGLVPLSEYLSAFGLKWDAKQYKKDLPRIESEWKSP